MEETEDEIHQSPSNELSSRQHNNVDGAKQSNTVLRRKYIIAFDGFYNTVVKEINKDYLEIQKSVLKFIKRYEKVQLKSAKINLIKFWNYVCL